MNNSTSTYHHVVIPEVNGIVCTLSYFTLLCLALPCFSFPFSLLCLTLLCFCFAFLWVNLLCFCFFFPLLCFALLCLVFTCFSLLCLALLCFCFACFLTLQCWPRCAVRTFNFSHALGLGTPYGREYIWGYYQFKTLPSWMAVGN